jgi:phospho-N-acetylmuramoyl-pentapeptide-transferase
VFGFTSVYAYNIKETETLFLSLILLGSCAATLCFNKHPAKVFMGDTGSLMLGGGAALILIKLNIPLWSLLLLGVCVFEAFSVILQLISIRFRKKKIFKIAPFHHHLEKSGWRETHIVYAFWGITLIFCVITFFITGGSL